MTADGKYLFTGSSDGVLAKWDVSKISDKRAKVQWFACDFSLGIISIDDSKELDIVVSASLDGTVSIRKTSTGKYLRSLTPKADINSESYDIRLVRLSYRGYILIVLKHTLSRIEASDYLMVYSINGEYVIGKKVEDKIYSALLDETGYTLVTGGSSGKINKYDFISLTPYDMLLDLDPELQGIAAILDEFLKDNAFITALELSPQENIQQLLIGNNMGQLYSFKYSPQLLGKVIFGYLKGLVFGK